MLKDLKKRNLTESPAAYQRAACRTSLAHAELEWTAPGRSLIQRVLQDCGCGKISQNPNQILMLVCGNLCGMYHRGSARCGVHCQASARMQLAK